MRGIKFRGKRVTSGDWVYGTPFLITEEFVSIITNCPTVNFKDSETEYSLYQVIPETVGQFTALTDKNGVEIYEGDKVRQTRKYNSHVSECTVLYRNGGFYLYYGNLIYNACEIINNTEYTFEVIGNIHENKES